MSFRSLSEIFLLSSIFICLPPQQIIPMTQEPLSHIFQYLFVPVYTFFPGSLELYSAWPNLSKGSPLRLLVCARVFEILLIPDQL